MNDISHDYQPELDRIHSDIKDMKSLMATMVDAISRIGIIEERHTTMAGTQDKVLLRLDEVVRAQHKAELIAAQGHDSAQRIKNLESAVLESHVESEKSKARLETVLTTIRILWAVISVFGFTGLGYLLTRIGVVMPVSGIH